MPDLASGLVRSTAEIDVGGSRFRTLIAVPRRRPCALDDVADEVLDVDEADRVVEGLAIDRHARMAGLLEAREELAERDVDLDRLDVGARHHDVLDAHVAEPQDVGEHRPLFRREAAGGVVRGERLGEILADGALGLQADGRLEAVEPAFLAALGWLGRAATLGFGLGVRRPNRRCLMVLMVPGLRLPHHALSAPA